MNILASEAINVVLVNSIVTFITAKPRFQDGEFTVEFKGTSALLSWPVPDGNFTRQTIQKRIKKERSKRAINECEGDCVEEEVPLNQTSHTTDVDPDKEYEFKLLLYDGNVVVQSLGGPTIKEGRLLYIS